MDYQTSHIVIPDAERVPPRAKTKNATKNAICDCFPHLPEQGGQCLWPTSFPPPPANFPFPRILKHVKETGILFKYLKHFFRNRCIVQVPQAFFILMLLASHDPHYCSQKGPYLTQIKKWTSNSGHLQTSVHSLWKGQERNIRSRNVGRDRSQIKND